MIIRDADHKYEPDYSERKIIKKQKEEHLDL